jgi:hypothetical protein
MTGATQEPVQGHIILAILDEKVSLQYQICMGIVIETRTTDTGAQHEEFTATTSHGVRTKESYVSYRSRRNSASTCRYDESGGGATVVVSETTGALAPA